VLKGPTGKPVGTLCLVDTTAREFDSRQANQLKKFGALVQAELLRSA
jgi:hypothetical protein